MKKLANLRFMMRKLLYAIEAIRGEDFIFIKNIFLTVMFMILFKHFSIRYAANAQKSCFIPIGRKKHNTDMDNKKGRKSAAKK